MFPCVIVLGFVQIREELRANGIDVYPQKEFDEDADDRMINDKIRVRSQTQFNRRCPLVAPAFDIAITNVYFQTKVKFKPLSNVI